MTEHYKGVRINELLEDIALWQSILEGTKSAVESEADVISVVEAEATMAIMKAKLTALQGEK
jgi:hypothetical protein